MEDLRYPIGKFKATESITSEMIDSWINEVAKAPALLRDAVNGMTEEQLDTPYRPDGWTVRQVIHHLPDSHMNSFIRFKLALTEDVPTIKPYQEDAWANLRDSFETPIEDSLKLFDALHSRWVVLLRSLSTEQWSRTFHHPEAGNLSLDTCLGLYVWHGNHHIAHITSLKQRRGWN